MCYIPVILSNIRKGQLGTILTCITQNRLQQEAKLKSEIGKMQKKSILNTTAYRKTLIHHYFGLKKAWLLALDLALSLKPLNNNDDLSILSSCVESECNQNEGFS